MQNFGPHARLFEQHALAYAGEQRLGARADRRPNRHMPPRAAKHLGGLFIDVTGEAHAVPLPRHVHAGPVGHLLLGVTGMRQRRTLPRAKFLSHRSLLLAHQGNSCVRAIGRGVSVAAQLAYQRLDLVLPVAVVGFAQRARRQLIDHHDESADLIEHLPAVSIRRAAHGIRQTLFGLRPERRAVPSSLELRWQETLLQVARERKAPPFRFSPKLRQLGVRYIDGQLWLHPFPPLPSRSVGACGFGPLSSMAKFRKRFPGRAPLVFGASLVPCAAPFFSAFAATALRVDFCSRPPMAGAGALVRSLSAGGLSPTRWLNSG